MSIYDQVTNYDEALRAAQIQQILQNPNIRGNTRTYLIYEKARLEAMGNGQSARQQRINNLSKNQSDLG